MATERQIQSLSTEKGASSSDVNYCQNSGRRQHGKSQQKNATKCKSCDTMHAPRACPAFVTRFNKIAIQGTPQMAVDKEAIICLSRVYSYYFKCNFPLFYL